MNIPSEYRTASIGHKHAMILSHNANPNPDGIFGKGSGCSSPSDYDIDLAADQLRRNLGEALTAALRPTILDPLGRFDSKCRGALAVLRILNHTD
jgi:hypothetical protein